MGCAWAVKTKSWDTWLNDQGKNRKGFTKKDFQVIVHSFLLGYF